MMQSLLEERFAMKAHHETPEGPIYRLVLAKKDGTFGPKLVRAGTLQSMVDRRIFDETALTGRFDVKLEHSRGQPFKNSSA